MPERYIVDLGIALSMQMDARFVARCRAYEISVAEAARAYVNQQHACAVCRRPFSWRDLVFDHNHRTRRFRGFLCGGCNTGLGMLGDSPAVLRLAATYLQSRGHYGGGMSGKSEDQILAWMADIDTVARCGVHLDREHRVRASEHRKFHRCQAALGVANACVVCESMKSDECLTGCACCAAEEMSNA